MSLPKKNLMAVGAILLSAVLVGGSYFIFLNGDPDGAGAGGRIPPEAAGAEATQSLPEPDGNSVAPDPLPLTVLQDAPFAQEFGAAGTSPARELELVQLAFGDYLSFVKERYRKPFGYHEELVALLMGENPLRVAPVPPGHPRIDQQGRLTDRWGTAFDIHPLSSTAIEVRSAGPDRKMHTADDLHNVTSSGQDILDAMRPVAGVGAEGASGEEQAEGRGQ